MTIDPRIDNALQSLILELAAEVRGSQIASARFANARAMSERGAIKMSYAVDLHDEFGSFTASIQDFGSGVGALSIIDEQPEETHTTVYELALDQRTGDYRSRRAIDRMSADTRCQSPAGPMPDLWQLPPPPEPDDPQPEILEDFTRSLRRLASISFAFARLLSIRDQSPELELHHLLLGLFANRGTHASGALAEARMHLDLVDAGAVAVLPLASAFTAPSLDGLDEQLRSAGFNRPAPPPSLMTRQAFAFMLDGAEELCSGDVLGDLIVFDLAHNRGQMLDRYVPAAPSDLWTAISTMTCTED